MRKIIAYAGLGDGCSWYRGLLPVRHCADELLAEHDISLELASNIIDIRPGDCDALFVHRIFKADSIAHFAMLKKHGTRIIWDTDDACDCVPHWSPVRFERGTLDLYDGIQGIADMKIASTPELGNRIGADLVLPNLIDPEPYDDIPKRPMPPGRAVQILWFGSSTHLGDLQMIEPALAHVLTKFKGRAKVTLWGESLPKLRRQFYGRGLDLMEAVPIGGFFARLKSYQPDICLCPLAFHPFNDCKSNIKWLESSIVGAASVVSQVPAYQSVDNGITGAVCTLPGDWITTLEVLIEDVKSRRIIAAQAEQIVREQWSWHSAKRQEWIEAFCEMVEPTD